MRRSLEAPVERLVDAGVIGSAEVLAGVVPQLTAPVVAAGVRDPALRRVLVALYRAFRRRRSLLLLRARPPGARNRELPWAEAITGARVDDAATRVAARRALGRVVDVAVCAWPATPAAQQAAAGGAGAGRARRLALPLVDELAADIFTGELSETFLRAARQAARFLAGTLYATYCDLRWRAWPRSTTRAPSRPGTPISPGLMSLIMERAGATSPFGRPAHNGTILEQAQIVTTHNLAALVGGLGLSPRIAARLPALARRAWDEVTRVLQTPRPRPRPPAPRDPRRGRRLAADDLLRLAPAGAGAARARDLGRRAPGRRARGLSRPLRTGLRRPLPGGRRHERGEHTAPEARVFVGWSTRAPLAAGLTTPAKTRRTARQLRPPVEAAWSHRGLGDIRPLAVQFSPCRAPARGAPSGENSCARIAWSYRSRTVRWRHARWPGVGVGRHADGGAGHPRLRQRLGQRRERPRTRSSITNAGSDTGSPPSTCRPRRPCAEFTAVVSAQIAAADPRQRPVAHGQRGAST
ncbi:MAG: hypothetical protein HS111_25750 [Kofleriaceae bacterium]|nr:hypothetical protein [Kofleriaceae bacterium]